MTHSFKCYIGSCILIFTTTVLAGKNTTTKLYLPVPMSNNSLETSVCQALFSYYSKNNPQDHFDLLNSKNHQVWAVEEQYVNLKSNPYGYVTNPVSDSRLSEIAAEMRAARSFNAQLLSEVVLQGKGIVNGPYADLNLISFAIRIKNREYRVSLSPKDIPSTTIETSPGVFESQAATTRWVFMIDDYFDINPNLIAATESSANVTPIASDEELLRIMPPRVLERIKKFNLEEEILGLPHDRHGQSIARAWNDGYRDGTFYPEVYFIVRDPKSDQRLGYLVLLELHLYDEIEDKEGLYRNHFGAGSQIITKKLSTAYRYLAHFDLSGNRMEIWKEENTEVPAGRRGLSTSRTRNMVLDDNGHFLMGEWMEAPVVENRTRDIANISVDSSNGLLRFSDGAEPTLTALESGSVIQTYSFRNQILFAKFSLDNSELFLSHRNGWLRIIDVKTGNKKSLMPISAKRIDELPNGDLLLSLNDKSVVHLNRSTDLIYLIARDFVLHAIEKDRIILFDHYRGFSQIPFDIKDNKIEFGGQSAPTTHVVKFFQNYGQNLPYTRHTHYKLLGHESSHFIAYDNDTAKYGVYRFDADRMRLLKTLTEHEVKTFNGTAISRSDNSSSIVAYRRGDEIILEFFDKDGKRTDLQTIEFGDHAIAQLYFLKDGDSLAIAAGEEIQNWQIRGGENPTKLDVDYDHVRRLIRSMR